MSAPKPGFLDLRSQSQVSLPRPLKSPRLHVAGEVPPELSPLDAFALQSRLLAKQLEESAKTDKRMSRLPPLTTSSPLIVQGRSEYFRSLSYDSYSDPEQGDAAGLQPPSAHSQPHTPTSFSTKTPEVEVPLVRPQSMHPRMSHIPPPPSAFDNEALPPPPVPEYARERRRQMQTQAQPEALPEAQQQAAGEPGDEGDLNLFGARRERSPSPLGEDIFTTSRPSRRQAAVAAMASRAPETSAVPEPAPAATACPQSPPEERPDQLADEPSTAVADVPAQQTQPIPDLPRVLQPQPRHRPQRLPLQPEQHGQEELQQPPPLSPYAMASPFTQSPEKFAHKSSFDASSGSLAPPRSLFPKRSSSIMSSPMETTTDDDGHSVLGSSFHSLGAPRKLSTSSGMVSPGLVSPGFGAFHRSPSFGSDMSAPLPRPSFNFSRPLSRVGTPGLESPARQASSDSHTSYSQSSLLLADDTANTPVSMHSEGFPEPSAVSSAPSGSAQDNNGQPSAQPPPSLVYSKFSLPRGKMLQRSSPVDSGHAPQPSSSFSVSSAWEQPGPIGAPIGGQAPPSPPTRPSSSSGVSFLRPSFERPSLERTKLSTEILGSDSPNTHPSRFSSDGARSFDETRGRSQAFGAQHDPAPRGRTPMSISTTNSGATSDSNSTLKPLARSAHSLASAVEIPAEEHVDKAIALHEMGQLNESTYHLRHAARQGHPTGMLLYALACRHGWGMRPNPREGAEWLRRAADCASIEIADDEALIKEGKAVNVLDRKTRKAQFALSIYELGVSYMNGWGIDQDRALALRCFEIAGSWGDVDALAEAGFCYAQGVGCKKNLKKSAKFYREAEGKGMSMVGNSWIHKSKYNEDKESIKSPRFSKEDKARSKSRSRGIFGIKHS